MCFDFPRRPSQNLGNRAKLLEMVFSRKAFIVSVACTMFFGSGCTRIFYASMKKLGKEKRDILVGRIVDAKKAQPSSPSPIFRAAIWKRPTTS
jgi:hypothetical protein